MYVIGGINYIKKTVSSRRYEECGRRRIGEMAKMQNDDMRSCLFTCLCDRLWRK